jgi:Fe2+ transport system protein B
VYGLIWRSLPGPLAVRVVLACLLALAVVFVLFEYVFPVAAPLVPFNDNTVGAGGTSG